MRETIGFIGLGQLGLPMAMNLLDAGYALTAYNRTASKAAALVDRGARQVDTPGGAVTPGGIVVSVLWDEASVEAVVRSEGFLERLGPGGVHISMSTVLPQAAKQLAELHARHGSAYVEAPVFGRPEAAAARQLWIPLAGPAPAKERARPLLTALGARGVFDFGPEVGAATVVKLAGNFLIISAARSLHEALSMAEKNGVDPRAVVDMLTQTLFTAPIYQSYGKMIAEKKASIAQSPIPGKDLALFESSAQQAGSQAPLAHHLRSLLGGAPKSSTPL